MNVYRSFDEIQRDENTILTVGTFDGVHRGHRLIIKRLCEISDKENLRSVILTLHPHPQIVLQKPDKKPIHLLTDIEERTLLFERLGLGHLLIIPFSKEFANTPPEKFVSEFLYGKVGMKKILIGYDHMFGKNREGDEDLLKRLSGELDFGIEKINAFEENDSAVSSTRIRNSILDNKIELANEMLGYFYFLRGEVVVGDKRGAELGYPTANIRPFEKNKLMPGNGVYFVSSVIDGKRYYGMANIGFRPTFTEDDKPILEVHYFDFEEDIYGRSVIVEFHNFIREERKFAGAEEFLAQLDRDQKRCLQLRDSFRSGEIEFATEKIKLC